MILAVPLSTKIIYWQSLEQDYFVIRFGPGPHHHWIRTDGIEVGEPRVWLMGQLRTTRGRPESLEM